MYSWFLTAPQPTEYPPEATIGNYFLAKVVGGYVSCLLQILILLSSAQNGLEAIFGVRDDFFLQVVSTASFVSPPGKGRLVYWHSKNGFQY